MGARRHYAVPRLLHEAGLLGRLFTDSYAGNKPRLAAALSALPQRVGGAAVARWLDRAEPAIPPGLVTSFEGLGIAYLAARRRARSEAELDRVFCTFAGRFCRAVLKEGLGSARAVWGFNSAMLEICEAARAHGIPSLVEQTILPQRAYRDLLAREVARWPGWQPALEASQAPAARAAREEAEWALASTVLCGSDFVRDAVRAIAGPSVRCITVPSGVDPARFPRRPETAPVDGRPLRVLFAGEVGLRKGAPYLLEAARTLGPAAVELRLAGRVALSRERLARYDGVAEVLGPVPRGRMQALYHWADALVLPSVCEGSAMVTYEALMSGLPVICTPNAGAVAAPGVHLVETGSAEAIAEALTALRAGALAAPDAEKTGRLVSARRYRDDLVLAARGLLGQEAA